MKKLSVKLENALKEFNPVVKISKTGSIYIKLSGNKIKEIRIADHNGRGLSRNVWELRTDAMTHRDKFNRVYNRKDLNKMVADLKLKAKESK